MEEQLNKSNEWKKIKDIFDIGKYEQLEMLGALSYKLCLSFVIQATQPTTIVNKHFVPAFSTVVAWLLKTN